MAVRKILSIFDLQVTLCFLPNFKSDGLSVLEKKQKIDFQDDGHLGFLIGTIFTIYLLSISFKSIGLSVLEKK